MFNSKDVYLSCDDKCTTINMNATIFDDGDIWCSLSFLTSNLKTNWLCRLKYAWEIVRGKKVCWAEVVKTNPEEMKKFFQDSLQLIEEVNNAKK